MLRTARDVRFLSVSSCGQAPIRSGVHVEKKPGFIGANWEGLVPLPPMTGLENHCTGNGTGGSNPSPSATFKLLYLKGLLHRIIWSNLFRPKSAIKGRAPDLPPALSPVP